MRRVVIAVVCLLLMTGATAGAAVSINTLIEQAKELDGQTVTVEGEVIGDVMIRGEAGWINVSDGTNDIGVWAPATLLGQIGQAGRYHQSGDRVRVTGIFRRADPEHGGDLLLRAGALEVIQAGGQVTHPVGSGRVLVAAIALGLAALLGFVRWRRS